VLRLQRPRCPRGAGEIKNYTPREFIDAMTARKGGIMRRWFRHVPTAVVGTLMLVLTATESAPRAGALSDQQRKFVEDAIDHAGLTSDQIETFDEKKGDLTTLGDAICGDLHDGNVAANEVIDLANDVKSLNKSMAKAEVSVYGAITDLCPDQISQRQDHWRDGE
jgi:Protein of unknown function (DUF732)